VTVRRDLRCWETARRVLEWMLLLLRMDGVEVAKRRQAVAMDCINGRGRGVLKQAGRGRVAVSDATAHRMARTTCQKLHVANEMLTTCPDVF